MTRWMVAGLVVVTSGLAGCGTFQVCEDRDDYKAVKDQAPLSVPDGLDSLPGSARLRIPASSTPPDAPKECLERPPRYSAEAPAAKQ